MSVVMRLGRLDRATATKSTWEAPVLAGHRQVEAKADAEVQLGLSWLLELRWVAVAGQLSARVVVRVFLVWVVVSFGSPFFLPNISSSTIMDRDPRTCSGCGPRTCWSRGIRGFQTRGGGGSDVERCFPRDVVRGDQ